jgi:hypothetical protein
MFLDNGCIYKYEPKCIFKLYSVSASKNYMQGNRLSDPSGSCLVPVRDEGAIALTRVFSTSFFEPPLMMRTSDLLLLVRLCRRLDSSV